MVLRTVNLSNTIDQWKNQHNSLATDVGDLVLITTPVKTSTVGGINSLYDSAGVANTIRAVARSTLSAGTSLSYSSGQFSVSTGGITATQLASNAVTTIKLLDDNVTYAKIQNVVTANRILGSKTAGGIITELQVDSDILGLLSVAGKHIQASTITDNKLATISTAGKVSNSATTATNANTANAIVSRDGSGNFSAGTITAALSGNASTATSAATLTTARDFSLTGEVTASAVSFNGSGAVALVTTIAANAVDSSNILALSVSSAKIQNNAVTFDKMADSAVGSNELRQAVQLIIYNSAGTALKTMYGAGE